MIQIIVGPALFAAGLLLIFLAINGVPFRLSVPKSTKAPTRGRLDKGDELVVEMLSEMLRLRDEIASLRQQVGSGKRQSGKAGARVA